jgi:hypothetical protein
MNRVPITRTRHRLLPNARRVLAKPYLPGEETLLPGQSRAHLLLERVLAIRDASTGVTAISAKRSIGTSRRLPPICPARAPCLRTGAG